MPCAALRYAHRVFVEARSLTTRVNQVTPRSQTTACRTNNTGVDPGPARLHGDHIGAFSVLECRPDQRWGGRRRLRFSRRFVLQVRRAVDVLIDKNRVSVRIDLHQTGRAGGRFDGRPAAERPTSNAQRPTQKKNRGVISIAVATALCRRSERNPAPRQSEAATALHTAQLRRLREQMSNSRKENLRKSAQSVDQITSRKCFDQSVSVRKHRT